MSSNRRHATHIYLKHGENLLHSAPRARVSEKTSENETMMEFRGF
jgi:hypothetical protein